MQLNRAAPQPPLVTRRKDLNVIAPKGLYPHEPEYSLTIFDVRIPGIAERLHRERAGWADEADIEALDRDHYALIVKPGQTRRPVS